MKIRSGFVSNSSSSSYIVYGYGDYSISKSIYDIVANIIKEKDDSFGTVDSLNDGNYSEDNYKPVPTIGGIQIEKDNYMFRSELKRRVAKYLDNHGLDFCFYDEDDYDPIATIGCVLTEGDVSKFEESLKKSKEVLSKFDKDHGTDFAKSAEIFSYYEEDY